METRNIFPLKLSDLADGELAGRPELPGGGGEVGCVLRDRAAVTALLKYTTNSE